MTILIVGLTIYLMPTLIAVVNKKKNSTAIFMLNCFTGWTGFGWVGSLVWACLVEEDKTDDYY